MKTFRVFSFSLAGLFLLIAAGCGEAPVPPVELPDDSVSYVSPAGWSLGYPKTWTTESAETGQTFFVAPDKKNSVDVMVSPNQREVFPLEELGKKVVDMMLQNGAEKDGTKSEVLHIPQGDAVKVSFVRNGENDQKVYGYQFGLYDSDTLYVLTFSGTKKGLDEHVITVGKIVGSFRFPVE